MADQAAGAQFKRGITLALAYSATSLATLNVVTVMPQIAAHFGGEPNAAALVPMVLAITTLALALTSPLIGWAADRVGPRLMLIAGLVLCGVSGIGSYVAADLMQLLVWRAVAGVALAAIIIAGNTLLANYFEGAERQKWIGYQMVVFGIIGTLVGLGSGWVGDIGWQYALLASCFTFLLVPTCFAFLNEVKAGEQQGASAAAAGHFPLAAVLGVCAFTLAFCLLTFLPAFCLGFILEARGVTSASQTGIAVATTAFIAIPASFAFSAAAKVSLRLKLIFSSIMLAASLFVLIVPGFTGVLLSAALTGIAAGFGMGTLFAWMMSTPPPAFAGRGLGMLQTAIYLGQFLAPPLGFSLAAALGGWTNVAIWLGVAALALVAVSVFSARNVAAASR